MLLLSAGRARLGHTTVRGSEFFSYLNPFSWLGWTYVFTAIIWAFLVSHLFIYLALTGIWRRYVESWGFACLPGRLAARLAGRQGVRHARVRVSTVPWLWKQA